MKENLKILVRAPNWIGDQILAYPFFYHLKKQYPNSEITVACVPWVRDLQYRSLIDRVFVLSPPESSSVLEKMKAVDRAALEIRERGPWDLAITLPQSFSSAWFLYRSGAKVRRGYRSELRRFLLTEAISMKSQEMTHRSQAYLDLLERGLSISTFWTRPSEENPGEVIQGACDRFEPQKEWPDANPMQPPKEPYFVLAPGSKAPARRWPLSSFLTWCRLFQKKTKWKGVIVGGEAEKRLAQELCESEDLDLLDWTGKGRVSDLSLLFQRAKFTISNDSGLAHVAALCGSPTYIVWGAGDPRRTEPMGPGPVQLRLNPVECWPCEKNQCFQIGEKTIQCLKGIHPEVVLEEMESFLNDSKKTETRHSNFS